MNKTLSFSRCYYILIGLAVLSAPFSAIPCFFVTPLLLILWIIEGKWQTKWNRLKESKTLLICCAFVLFWFINFIGLFYSNDLVRGVMRTYDKLPFLVYPLVFLTLDKTFFTKEKTDTLLKAYLCAAATMLLICWGNACIQYINTGSSHHFFYVYFSKLFGHPAYCTLTACIGFCISFYFFSHSTGSNRWIWIALIFLFSVSVYFLQSRSGILALLVVYIFSLFYYVNNHKKRFRYGLASISLILIFTAFLIFFFPNRNEINVKKMNKEDKNIVEEMLGLRREIWSISWNIAVQNKMLGIGTGYYADGYLSEEGLKVFNPNKSFINTHNQYLQTFLEHGIFGVFVLVFLIIYTFYHAIKTKNYLLLMLLLIISVNMLFESMLERNRGIFTISLCYCLFLVKNYIFVPSEKEKTEAHN